MKADVLPEKKKKRHSGRLYDIAICWQKMQTDVSGAPLSVNSLSVITLTLMQSLTKTQNYSCTSTNAFIIK